MSIRTVSILSALKKAVTWNKFPSYLPLPQTPITERVEKILAAPDSPAVLQLKAEIDRLVYTLYGLTDEEIAVVEGKPNGVRS